MDHMKLGLLSLVSGGAVTAGLMGALNSHHPLCIASFCVFVPLASLAGLIGYDTFTKK